MPGLTARAALLRAFREPLSVEEVELLDLEPHRVLVSTRASPFCSTDVISWRGDLGKVPPTILGHTSVGEVLDVGSAVTRFRPGQRVVVHGTPECGTCYYCARGRPDQCSELFDLGGIYPDVARTAEGRPVSCAGCVGGYADTMNVSEHQLVAVDTDLPSEVLALMGCGITSGVGSVLNIARVEPGESVAIFGAGHLGLWAVQASLLARAEAVIVVEPDPGRRALATRIGATHVVDPDEVDPVAAVRELTAGRGADASIEAAATPAAQRAAVAATRRAGRVVLNGLERSDAEVAFPQVTLALESRDVMSSQNGRVRMHRDVPRYVGLLERGLLDASAIITSRYALDDINKALEKSRDREDISGVIVF